MNNFVRHLTLGTELDLQGQIVHVHGGDEKHDGECFELGLRHDVCLQRGGVYRHLRTMVRRRRTRSSAYDRCHEPVSIEADRAKFVIYLSVERKGSRRLVRSINRVGNEGPAVASTSTSAQLNPLPAQPTMQDLLARLTVAPSTPPAQSRSPALTSSQSAQQFQNRASPRPEPAQTMTTSVSDPSASLKQLLGVMSPGQTSLTPNRTNTPPARLAPESPSVSRPRVKKGDSGYIPSADRNVESGAQGLDKEAARVAVAGALKEGRAEAKGIQSGSTEPSKEGQRDFVRGLLNCIHVSRQDCGFNAL